MSVNPNDFCHVKVIFDGKQFIQNNTRSDLIDPQALQKIESLLNDMNNHCKSAYLRFPNYIFVFFVLYIVSLLPILITGKYYLLFIPIIFFLIALIGFFSYIISYNNFAKKISKTIDAFREEISQYYIIINKMRFHKRKYERNFSYGAMYFIPVENAHLMADVNTNSPYFVGTQINRIHVNTPPINNRNLIQNNNNNSFPIYQQIPESMQQSNNINLKDSPENVHLYTYKPDEIVKYDRDSIQDKHPNEKDTDN